MAIETKNAVITGTNLFIERDMLTAFVNLEYGKSSGQGFGGYELDKWDEGTQNYIPSKSCGLFIRRVLETVGVDKWENLKGKHVRVKADREKIYAIGHILENSWFEPESEFEGLLLSENEKS